MGVFQLLGLRSGHSYTLDSLTLVRVASQFQVILGDAFVGASPHDSRGGDPFGLYSGAWTYDDEGNLLAGTALTRTGAVLVDGIVAAELFGIFHQWQSGDPGYWKHTLKYVTDSDFLYPSDGLVQANVPLTFSDPSYEGVKGIEAPFLCDPTTGQRQGIFSGGTSYTFNAQAWCNWIRLPTDMPRQFRFVKWRRGLPVIRVINTAGAGSVPVTVQPQLVMASGAAVNRRHCPGAKCERLCPVRASDAAASEMGHAGHT